MRFLVNENIASSVISGLRQAGHDVLSAKESMRGRPDGELLSRAQAEHRVLVTHDKDFGELAFRSGLPADSGVVLLRFTGDDPSANNARALTALTSRDDWAGHFSVVDSRRVRMRGLG